MKRAFAILALVLAGGAATAAAAADVKTQPPAQATAATKPEHAFGDWRLRCREIAPGDTACMLHQRIIARETKLPVAAFAISRNKNSRELRLIAVLPLGLDIPAGVSGKAGSVPLTFTVQTCVRRGCVASLTVDEKLLESLKGADALTATFKMRNVAGPTSLPVSLKGLDEGLKALESK